MKEESASPNETRKLSKPFDGYVTEAVLPPREPASFEEILEPQAFSDFRRSIDAGRIRLEGRTIWQINSTPQGGGVAEMLETIVPYMTGAGIESRWLVIEGNDEFFEVTKRIHNLLHGSAGDGGSLGDAERATYEQTLQRNEQEVLDLIEPGDVVFFNDPQTAGLVGPAKRAGAKVVWRCHVGCDVPNDYARHVWNFLWGYIEHADASVFSRHPHVWESFDDQRVAIIPPSIDAYSAKNQVIGEDTVASILERAGLFEGVSSEADPSFRRADGSAAIVGRKASFVAGDPPPFGFPAVIQISRWDRLKDPLGVMAGFAQGVASRTDAHLILAGPAVSDVADDPAGAEVLDELTDSYRSLDTAVGDRIHLAVLPMGNDEENSAIVNALQRRADVIVQKSLAEGFGLTVAEGMWKRRAVVASKVGGIQDQIEDGISGRLTGPEDLNGFGDAVHDLLVDPERARAMGEAAHQRVRDRFLDSHHITHLIDLAGELIEA